MVEPRPAARAGMVTVRRNSTVRLEGNRFTWLHLPRMAGDVNLGMAKAGPVGWTPRCPASNYRTTGSVDLGQLDPAVPVSPILGFVVRDRLCLAIILRGQARCVDTLCHQECLDRRGPAVRKLHVHGMAAGAVRVTTD